MVSEIFKVYPVFMLQRFNIDLNRILFFCWHMIEFAFYIVAFLKFKNKPFEFKCSLNAKLTTLKV